MFVGADLGESLVADGSAHVDRRDRGLGAGQRGRDRPLD